MDEYLVIYSTTTGFTERYAAWIAEELECEAIPLAVATPPRIKAAKTIVYGGPLHAGCILGLSRFEKLRKLYFTGKTVVFGVGLTPVGDKKITQYKAANMNSLPKDTPFHYFRGGMDIDKLKGFNRFIIKVMAGTAKKNPEYGKEEESDPLHSDYTDRELIKPMIDEIRSGF